MAVHINGKPVVASGTLPIEQSDRIVTIEHAGETGSVLLGFAGNFTAREPVSAETFARHVLEPGHFITKSLTPGSKYVLRCCLQPYSDLSPAFYVLSYAIFADELEQA